MIDAVRQQAGQNVREVLADSGYCSENNLRHAAKKKIDLYIATEKNKHYERVHPVPRGRIPKAATLVERMRRKLQTKPGRAIYSRRKTIVEPVFGQIKRAAASVSSCYAAWKRCAGNGRWSAQRTTC